jgi:hypothetical protein
LAGGQEVRSLIQASDGGFVLAGRTFPSNEEYGTNEFWVLKTDVYGIPEFPSQIILPLLLAIAMIVVIYRKKLHRTPKAPIILGY